MSEVNKNQKDFWSGKGGEFGLNVKIPWTPC
ncbi:MAG: hypothetical protein Ct9H300mP20_15260 [Gammaproteobacteria bacterium]|nr:MAG: hypothetical protein Ct9H300mP20_15260 [Gammaproteobacteria bacterium]